MTDINTYLDIALLSLGGLYVVSSLFTDDISKQNNRLLYAVLLTLMYTI